MKALLVAGGFLSLGCQQAIGWETVALVSDAGDDSYENRDAFVADVRPSDSSADGDDGDACSNTRPDACQVSDGQTCQETCSVLESREPRLPEVDGRARVLKLKLEQTDCRHLRFQLTKLDSEEQLHSGEYRLLAGSCKRTAPVLALVVVNEPAKYIEMTVDYDSGTCWTPEKLFCAAKKDGNSISYWFSNIVLVGNRCDCGDF